MKKLDDAPIEFSGEWLGEVARYLCRVRHKPPIGMICPDCGECVGILADIMNVAALSGLELDEDMESNELQERCASMFEHLTHVVRQMADDADVVSNITKKEEL